MFGTFVKKRKGENYEKEIKLDVEIRQENLLYYLFVLSR